MTTPDELLDTDGDTAEGPAPEAVGPLTQGEAAPSDVYEVFGYYEDIDDGEGGTISVERLYPTPRYASALAPGERGVLLAATGDEVTAKVAYKTGE